MLRHSDYEKRDAPVEYLNFQFVAPTEEIAATVREASEQLHWFQSDYLAVNFLIHTYYSEQCRNENVQVTRINQVYTWLKELHTHPEYVIIGETTWKV